VLRRFRLRNNAVVEERPGDKTITRNGYIDDYVFIGYGDIHADEIAELKRMMDDNICLRSGNGFPEGGWLGPDYDIVEELFEDSQATE
jgi:hypothetical protein